MSLAGTSIDQLKTMKIKEGEMIPAMSSDGDISNSHVYSAINSGDNGNRNQQLSSGNMYDDQMRQPPQYNNNYNSNKEAEDLARDLNISLGVEDHHTMLLNNPKYNRNNRYNKKAKIDKQNKQKKKKEIEEEKQISGGYLNRIPEVLREPLIIIFLFIILSQSSVKNKIGEYVRQINPGPDGTVSFAGIFIYAIIFALLYVLLKKLLL